MSPKETVWHTKSSWCQLCPTDYDCIALLTGRIQLVRPAWGSSRVKRTSAPGWWSVWGSLPVQRKRKLSDWSPLAVTRPLASAALHASPAAPCSADEQVPGEKKKKRKRRYKFNHWNVVFVQCNTEVSSWLNKETGVPEVSCEGSSGCSSQPKAPGGVSWLQGTARGWSSSHIKDW